MRKEFSESLEKIAANNKKIVFLTGDLGFMAFEGLMKTLKGRFVNVGVCEQNMITMAAGLASEGLTPVCYSIAPFAVFRPAEQIRLDVCLHNMNVKIVGNGGGYGYGIMGSTHHAIEDIAVISSFQNMKCFIPFCNEDVDSTVSALFKRTGPSYLRLGYGKVKKGVKVGKFSAVRKITSGNRITIVSMGPVSLNILDAIDELKDTTASVELFVISEIPLISLGDELIESIKKTKKLYIVEEHVKRGGLAENIAILLMEKGISCKFRHSFAAGYPNGLCGSQAYHQRISGLDKKSIAKTIREINHG